MAALALGEIGLDILFALRFVQIFLHGGIGTQFQGMLPRGNRILSTIASLLRIAQHGVGVGRLGRRAHRTLGVGQRLRSVSGAHQQGGVIDKDG